MGDGAAGPDDLARVRADTRAIVDVLATAPAAPIGCYEGWTVVELASHVGQIHRWVTGIVETRATSRPTSGYPAAPDPAEVPAWLVAGADALVAAFTAAGPGEQVWTISRHQRDVAFWRRRMVLETALHRWDAEVAAGRDATVDDTVAQAGVAETLDVYLAQRLDGTDVGGDGERVAFVPTHGTPATLVLRADGVDLVDGDEGADARVHGSALDLWLLLTCRRPLAGLDVAGDATAAAMAVRAATLSPGPA